MDIMGSVKKYFQGGEWKVLYRQRNDGDWKMLQNAPGFWHADPFLLKHDDKNYLFTEAFDERKAIGKIAVSVMKNGTFTIPKVIIENNYHMSYPDVFCYGGKVYMIPETSEGNNLELYEAADFPYMWNRLILKRGISRVDTTVYIKEDAVYLISFDEQNNVSELYLLHMEDYSLELLQSRQYQEFFFRPAGNFFISNGNLYRPTQNCSQRYGGSLIINRIEDLRSLKEERIAEYFSFEIGERYDALHTYNRCGAYETVDVFVSTTGIKCFVAKCKRKLRRISMSKVG